MIRYLVACMVCAIAFLQFTGIAWGQQCDGGSHRIAYVVRSGDSLTAIAKKYDLSIDDLVNVNPSLNSRSMVITNQTIQVPVCNDPPAASPSGQTAAPGPAAQPPAPDPAAQAPAPSPAAPPAVPVGAAQQGPARADQTTTAPAKSPETGIAPQPPQAAPASPAVSSETGAQAAGVQPSRNGDGQGAPPASPEPSPSTHPLYWDKASDSPARAGEAGTGIENLLVSEAPKAVFVILLSGAAMWLLWRYWGRQPVGRRLRTSHLTILETRKLGTRHALYVVGYGSRIFLIGAAQGNINLLADLAPQVESQREIGKTAEPSSPDFADHLAQAVEDGPDLGALHPQSPMRDLVARIWETSEGLRSKTARLRDCARN